MFDWFDWPLDFLAAALSAPQPTRFRRWLQLICRLCVVAFPVALISVVVAAIMGSGWNVVALGAVGGVFVAWWFAAMLCAEAAEYGAKHGARSEADRNRPKDRKLIGQVGTAVTPLRPSGRVAIEGRNYEAVSEGTLIEAGALVKVVDASAFAVVVRVAEDV